jgi:hypothetical protein
VGSRQLSTVLVAYAIFWSLIQAKVSHFLCNYMSSKAHDRMVKMVREWQEATDHSIGYAMRARKNSAEVCAPKFVCMAVIDKCWLEFDQSGGVRQPALDVALFKVNTCLCPRQQAKAVAEAQQDPSQARRYACPRRTQF